MRERVFIVCGGTSLDDVSLNWLKFEDTIAVNYQASKMTDPTYFLTADSGVIRRAVENNFWNNKTKNVVVINKEEHPRWKDVKQFIPSYDEHVIPTRWNGDISLDDKEFATGKNTGFCALQYAVRLGYKKIYLLGIDLQKVNGRKYHYSKEAGGSDSPYDVFYQHFKTALEKLKGKVEVYSCSPISRLNIHIPYIELNKLVPKMPIFISHYTVNTPYEKIVKRLEDSLIKYNLDYEFTPIKHLGTWRANSNYCAVQVRDMLEKYKPRPILRVDADAVIEEYPELFIQKYFKRPDVAGCIYRESKLKPKGEFMGGTLYFGNTNLSRDIAQQWLDICQQKPTHRNGDLLWDIIRKIKAMNFYEMPLSYCKIFDFRNMGPEGVIVHYQASRKNKGIVNKMKAV